MSRHEIKSPSDPRVVYAYGYDHPLRHYFLQAIVTIDRPDVARGPDGLADPIMTSPSVTDLVGHGNQAARWSAGTAADLREAMTNRNIWSLIPEPHRQAIVGDLPIPDGPVPATGTFAPDQADQLAAAAIESIAAAAATDAERVRKALGCFITAHHACLLSIQAATLLLLPRSGIPSRAQARIDEELGCMERSCERIQQTIEGRR